MPFTACDADNLPVNHQLPRPGARDVAGDPRAFAARVSFSNLNPNPNPNSKPDPDPNPNQARVSSYPAIVPESYKPLSEAHEVIHVAA